MRRSEANKGRGEEQQRKKPSPNAVKIEHDTINEQVVIAASCVSLEARKKCIAAAPVDAFYGKGHAEIWGVIAELERRGLAYDPATVKQLSNGIVESEYLESLIRARPTVPPNLDHHLKVLLWDHTRIETARGPLAQFLDALKDPTAEEEKVQSLARSVDRAMSSGGNLRYLRDPDKLVANIRKSLDRRHEGAAIFPYGLEGFDRYGEGETNAEGASIAGEHRVIPGAAPGQVTVVTAVPGSGKTTTICKIAAHQACSRGRVLVGAWEQDAEVTLELVAVIDLGYSRRRFATGKFTEDEKEDVLARCEELAPWIRFFDLPFGKKQGERQFNDRNLDMIHSYIAQVGADVFIADLWRRALRQIDPEEEEQALYRQQAICAETKCHGILLQQQKSKEVEQRPDKRPTRDAIKGSGTWTEVADTIIGIHLPALWKNVPNDKIEMILLKQRHGEWPLAVEFDYDPDHGQMLNGRSFDYARPGEMGGMDAWLNGDRVADNEKKKGGRGGSKGRSRRG